MDEVLTEATPAALVHAVEAHQRETSVRWTSVQGGVVEELPDLVRYAAGHREAFTNGAQAARLAPERADEAIRDTIAFFDRHRVAALWWVGPLSEPGDLGDRLLRHGFRLDERMPWLAAVVPDAPAVDAPSELRIERVSDDRLQAAWLEAMERGFGFRDDVREAISALAEVVGHGADAEWIRWVGFVDADPVASSGLMLGGGVAGIYNVATDPQHRRRGYGRAMTATALAHARERGYRVAILGASETGRGVYEALGFRHVCDMDTYEWKPSAGG